MAYTTIDDPSAHFQIALYSGNGTTGQAITNDGNSDLQPDWIWFKRRDDTGHQRSFDSTRGVTKRFQLNEDNAEATNTGKLTSFDSDGFTLGTDSADIDINQSSSTMVAWQWKANGGTRTTNTESGNNPGGGYQANTTAGFSIVDYTGTGATGTMAHGLGAVPHCIIAKQRTQVGGVAEWVVYHQSMGNTHYMKMSTTAAQIDSSGLWNDTSPTSSVFTVNTSHQINEDTGTYIAYAFTEIQGYSKFGSYTGNGNADGPFVYTGFRPAWLMIKKSSGTEGWHILDIKRDDNENNTRLQAESDGTDDTSEDGLDMLSNGFKIRTSWAGFNTSDGTYVYMTFAEHPFVSSKGVPCTAI